MTLTTQHCAACLPDAPKMAPDELAELMQQLPEWQILAVNQVMQLERVFIFRNFRLALDFTNRVGNLAEQEDHHPAIVTEWGKVTVRWWTHAIAGLHRNDLICAAKTDALLAD
ncbi:4a-hydroxytetrahydrobiopterin dehydratase [Reinekea forsetii]|mgnify:FL=1|nr:4a-hydroxytetrahydrobiopterin dehydratase [Reinekea forsetii]